MLAQEASAGLSRGLDAVQVHAVAPKILSAHQHDDSRRPPAEPGVGGPQPVALRRRERAVVEIEMQIADRAALFVADLAAEVPSPPAESPGSVIPRRARQGLGELAESQRCGTLETAVRALDRLQLADPDRAVGRWRGRWHS